MRRSFSFKLFPIALILSLSISFFIVKFFTLPRLLLPFITALIALPLIFLSSSLLPSWKVEDNEFKRQEIVELENFLTLFSSYLKLGLSPEASLLKACNQYSGALKSLFTSVIQSAITTGGSASDTLIYLSRKLRCPESRRILILFSRALKMDSKRFGNSAMAIISCLKENRALKEYVDLLFSKMRLRASLLAVVSSAVLAVMTRLAPLFSILRIAASSTELPSAFPQSPASSTLFMALSMLAFMNSYFVSLIVHHRHPLLLSAASIVVYALVYLLFPQLLLSF
ncbi:MAG: hypothetical protein NDF55_09580 [archaeon GB-1867-005]|nr:hypothetical protein [Candidatus Culexmicrobium cathedralense]